MSGQSARPIDVLFIITALGVGGSERQLTMLASALPRADFKVAVYAFQDGPVRAELEAADVEVMLAPWAGEGHPFGVPKIALDLFRIMRRRRPRIVHFFLPAAYLVGAPMAVLAGVPLRVMSRRSLNNYQRYATLRGFERCCHRAMHAILGNSRSVINELREEGVSPERLGLIYNGIDVQTSPIERGAARAGLGLSSPGLVMSVIANLIPYKGHSDLIDALAQAAPHLPAGWRLLVVGRDDGIGETLREQAGHLGLADHILFMGPRDDVAAILAASDIGILCSHEEGFSNAVLEGMAARLPMVVTRVGGNAEAVIDGETGIVVPPRAPAELAAGILRLATDPDLRARFGAAGRHRVEKEFRVDRFVQAHCALYRALQAGRSPADIPELVAAA